MVPSPTVKALLDLERRYEQQVLKYSEALKGVRKLIKLEQGESEDVVPSTDAHAKQEPVRVVRGDLPHNFSTFKKADAAEYLLKLDGPLSAQELFDEMQGGKHMVKNKASLVAMLSSTDKFKFEDGKWSLAEETPVRKEGEM